MPRKSTKKTLKPVRPQLGEGVEILNAGSVLEDPITRTLETNYMPYAMSVIVSRALPEIDGFKPAHRKLLYTMYGMGLLKDVYKRQGQRHGVQLVAFNVGAAEVDVIAVKADDFIIPGTHRKNSFLILRFSGERFH